MTDHMMPDDEPNPLDSPRRIALMTIISFVLSLLTIIAIALVLSGLQFQTKSVATTSGTITTTTVRVPIWAIIAFIIAPPFIGLGLALAAKFGPRVTRRWSGIAAVISAALLVASLLLLA